VVRLDLFFSYGANTRVRNRIFFTYAGAGPSNADMTTWLATVHGSWNTNMAPVTNASLTLTQVEGTDLASASGAQVITTTSRVGTLAGTALPAQAAMVIKFKVNRRYRGGHPRFYLPGRVTADLASTVAWTAGAASGVATAWAAFIAACTTTPPATFGAMSHANVSYFTGFTNKTFPSGRTRAIPNPRGTPTVDAVQSYSVNGNLGSQRRRSLQSA
jgi:hypothetical protein